MTLEQLLVLSVLKPEILPDNINMRKLGILDDKIWNTSSINSNNNNENNNKNNTDISEGDN